MNGRQMVDIRQGDWFLSSKGKKIFPIDMQVEDVDIEDIAHSLSNICRFGGHCKEFYSVAQHSVLTSLVVKNSKDKKSALLHDATEAYCGDMVRPLKHMMPEYRTLEDRIWLTITKAFDLPYRLPSEVEKADARILLTEKRDLLICHSHKWDFPQCAFPNLEPYDFKINPWSPSRSKREFLSFYQEYCRV